MSNPPEKVLQIYVVESQGKFYLSDIPINTYMNRYCSETRLSKLFINGSLPNPSFHNAWVVVDKIPEVIHHFEKQPRVNYRYHLIDESLCNDHFPLEMPQSEVQLECSTDWKPELAHMRSLYTLLSDEVEPLKVNDPFEIVAHIKAPKIIAPGVFSFPIKPEDSWRGDKNTKIERRDIQHTVLSQLMFPSLIIHNSSARLSSHDSYKIIRAHVQQNIDPRVAKITSDYDFCFTVVKILAQVPHEEMFRTIFAKRLKTTKKWITAKEVKCFEMTWNPENYRGYTPIHGFEAENEDALAVKIDEYLDDLMAMINEPLKECSACKGLGVVTIGLNKK